jgi:hypothetical protein
MKKPKLLRVGVATVEDLRKAYLAERDTRERARRKREWRGAKALEQAERSKYER